MTSLRPWVVLSTAAWRGAEARTTAGLGPVITGTGMWWPDEVDPAASGDFAFWMPSQVAARAVNAGVELTLTDPGARWIADLPDWARRREVHTAAARYVPFRVLGDLGPDASTGKVFAKLAVSKDDRWSAGVHTLDELVRWLDGLPADELVQWTSTVFDIRTEVRCFVLDGEMLASSSYVFDGLDYSALVDRPDLLHDSMRVRDEKLASDLADLVAGAMRYRSPRGYVLDVAVTRDDETFVVEANPAWCSSWYDCNLDGVRRVVDAACAHDPVFAWRPSPLIAGSHPLRLPS